MKYAKKKRAQSQIPGKWAQSTRGTFTRSPVSGQPWSCLTYDYPEALGGPLGRRRGKVRVQSPGTACVHWTWIYVEGVVLPDLFCPLTPLPSSILPLITTLQQLVEAPDPSSRPMVRPACRGKRGLLQALNCSRCGTVHAAQCHPAEQESRLHSQGASFETRSQANPRCQLLRASSPQGHCWLG